MPKLLNINPSDIATGTNSKYFSFFQPFTRANSASRMQKIRPGSSLNSRENANSGGENRAMEKANDAARSLFVSSFVMRKINQRDRAAKSTDGKRNANSF